MAKVLEREIRSIDIVGRYGGDEFMAILPETDRDEGVSCANRLFEALSHERVQPLHGESVPLVLSMGIAVCPDDSMHREELIAYADASLAEAKQVSGSAVVVTQREPGEIITRERSPFGVLDALVRAVDRKDRYTRRHSQQNAEFAVELGKAVGLTEGAVSALRIAGLLHDVGKIGVPDDILKKPGPLSDEERALMREHVVLSNLIVHGIPELEDVSDAVYCHHERWDGMGYPRGLKGEEIPLPGRIMALVDAYSAMILDRPYRKALTDEEAVAELRRNSGTQFDPELVGPFIQLLESSEAAAA
jgi:HD-GYP domain-containing protein (c-di-GMP phosphodiesterase class II)